MDQAALRWQQARGWLSELREGWARTGSVHPPSASKPPCEPGGGFGSLPEPDLPSSPVHPVSGTRAAHAPLTCSRQHSPLISSRSSTRIAILNCSAAVNRTTDWRRYARHRHRAPLVGVASWVLAAGGLAVVFRLRPRVCNRVRALLPRGRRRAVRAGCRASTADSAAEVDERCKREPTTVPDA